MDTFTLVSGNQFKINQWKKIIPDIQVQKLNLKEIQGSPKDIIFEKCMLAWERLKRPVIVEDVSLFLHGFKNFPGPYIKWLNEDLNVFLDKQENQLADFVHHLAYFDGNDFKVFSEIETVVIKKSTQENSFSGFEHQIRPLSCEKTFDKLDWETYQAKSPRIRNIKFVLPYLNNLKNEKQ